MAVKGARVHVYGDWDGSGIKRAKSDLSTFGKNVDGFSKSVKGSFLGIGAAIGAAFSLDAVINFMKGAAQAAMEDERSMVALAKAMENVGLAAQNAGVEAFVEDLSLARGVADDQLRPAMQRILTVTRNVAESQKALSLALDISAGTGRDLDSVTQALARAYSGQTTALQRLGVGLDAATLKSKDMDLISRELNERFAGQSVAAANTYQGQLNRLNVAVGEATENIGYSLLNALDKTAKLFGGAGGLQSAIERATGPLINFTDGIADLSEQLDEIGVGANSKASQTNNTLSAMGDAVDLVGGSYAFWNIPDQLAGIVRQTRLLTDANYKAEFRQQRLQRLIEESGVWMPAYVEMLRKGTNATLLFAGKYQEAAEKIDFNASAFYGVNPSAQRAMAEARANVDQIVSDYQEQQREQENVGSSAGRTAEVLKVKWAEIAQSVDGAVVRITGRATEVSGKLATTFQERTDQFRNVINEQVRIIQSAQQSLDDYAGKVTDAIMGKIDFTQTDAEGKPLTPEQIVTTLIGDIANQQAAVTKIAESGIMTQLPVALAEKILALPPDAAVALANYFSANPTQLAQLTTNYNALATFTETALGVPMANTFAKVGDQSAVSMIVNARGKIAEQAEAFRRFVQNRLSTEITVGVRYVAVNSIPGVSGGEIRVDAKANGGPLFAGLPTLVGERGPELIVPQVAGTVVRGEKTRQMLRQSGGDVYLTVNAGMGTNGAEVGRQIVDALKAYERRNGPVYASA